MGSDRYWERMYQPATMNLSQVVQVLETRIKELENEVKYWKDQCDELSKEPL